MKKFLSLVLALVMTMSLVTISAGAKDFTDDSSITYGEAVDVVSALKIVDGYTDGSFNPSATLTRGAAAKIICNLILGPTTASALVADSAPYVDVPTSNTFAGYIAYCQQQGIISGYADGTFRPAGTLTGYAFMKMLLGALGYDAKIEGFVGANWSVQVAKTAIGAGLNKGNDDFNGVQPVTREQAALYAFNTLKADMVDYDDRGSSITVAGVEIVTSPSKAEPVRDNTVGKLDAVKFSSTNALQFGEKYFKDLSVNASDADNFGRPANVWKLKGAEIGKYGKTATLTYTDEVSGDTIWKDLGKPSVNTTKICTNGKTNNTVPGTFAVADSNKTTKLGGHGITVQVYSSENGDSTVNVTIVVVENYGAKVQSVTEARGSNKRYVTLDNGKTFETEEFEEDDVVVYTETVLSGVTKVRTMAPAEMTADQKVAKINRTKNTFTAGEKTYDFSANVDANSPDTLTAGNTYDVYTDANGYVVYIEETEASVNQYAVVIDSASSTWTTGTGRVRLLLSDGKKVEVNAKISHGSIELGEIVTYTVDDDGTYDIDADPTVVTVSQVKKDVSRLNAGGTAYADNKTVFFVLTTKNGTSEIASGNELDSFEIITGVKNISDVDLTGATRKDAAVEGTTAKAVVLTNTSLSNSDMTYVISKGFNMFVEKSVQYYAFNAVVDGEITTLEIKASEVNSKLDANSDQTLDSAVFAIKNSNTNNNGRATSITLATMGTDAHSGVVTTGYKKEVVYIGGVYYTVDKDADIFVVADDGEVVAATAASLSKGQKVIFDLDNTDERIVSAVVYTDIDNASPSVWH